MGTGIIVPPTRLSYDGVTWDSGDVRLIAGAGLYLSRPLPKQMQYDALRIDSPEVFSMFYSGAISAVTLGKWSNNRASQRALVAAMEANFRTAQTTADPANYFAMKIADAAGTNAVLPFTTAAQAHFDLNQSSGQIIAQIGTGAGSNQGNDSPHNGACRPFTPTQNLTVTGVYWRGGWENASNNPAARNTRCQILDANLNVITTAHASTAAVLDNKLYFAFPLAVTLLSGTQYFLAIDIFEVNDRAVGFHYILGGANQSAPITVASTPTYGGITATMPTNYTGTWAQAIAAGYAAAGLAAGDVWNTGANNRDETALLGSGAGTTLAGDLTLSIVTVGAPLGTAAGSDLNARVLLNPA